MPAFGFSAVPLPTNSRRMLPGCHPPTAAATSEPIGSALMDAAAARVVLVASSSRREAANVVHANGANTGASPLPPPAASHDKRRLEATPTCEVEAAAELATALAGTAVPGDSAAAAGASAAGAPFVDTTAVTTSDGGGVVIKCGAALVMVVSLAEPAWPSGGVTTTAVVLLFWRGLTAADEDAPLRGVLDEFGRLGAALLERRGEASLVDAGEGPADAWSPVEPAEPVVSAYARGNALAAEPTPKATANAPTRPMQPEKPLVAICSVAVTTRRPYSIARTRPRAERR